MDFNFDEQPAQRAEGGLDFPVVDSAEATEGYAPPVIAEGGDSGLDAAPAPVTTEAPATDAFVPPVVADAPPPVAAGGGGFGFGDMQSIEASKMTEKTNEALRARDEEADKMHKEIREKAAATLAKMKGDRDSAIAARKSTNQKNEKEQAAEHAKLFSDGPIWDRVISLVDTKSDCRRTARMREIYGYLQGQS